MHPTFLIGGSSEGDFYSLVKSFVVHLLSVGQVGPDYEGKHPLLVSFPRNVCSWIVEDIAYPSQNKRTLVILSTLLFILTLLLPLVKLHYKKCVILWHLWHDIMSKCHWINEFMTFSMEAWKTCDKNKFVYGSMWKTCFSSQFDHLWLIVDICNRW
jgi:hypothetical protein